MRTFSKLIGSLSTLSRTATILVALLCGLALGQVLFYETVREILSYRVVRSILPQPKPEPTISRPATAPRQETDPEVKRILEAQKEFQADGTLHLVRTIRPRPRPLAFGVPSHQLAQRQVHDADGKLLWSGLSEEGLPYKYLFWSKGIWQHRYAGLKPWGMAGKAMLSEQFSRSLTVPACGPDGNVIERWDYLPRRQCFAGYNVDNKRIGFAGAKGYADSVAQAGNFGQFMCMVACQPREGPGPELIWQSAGALYRINFSLRRIEKLFETETHRPVTVGMGNWRVDGPHTPVQRPLVYCINADGEVQLLLHEPQQHLSFRLPTEWWPGNVSFAAAGDRLFVRYQRSQWQLPANQLDHWRMLHGPRESEPGKHRLELHELTDSGKLSLMNRYEWTRPPRAPPRQRSRRRWWRILAEKIDRHLKSLSPPLYGLVSNWIDLGRGSDCRLCGEESILARYLRELLEVFRPVYLGWNLMLSGLLVCLVLLHYWPRRTSWAAMAGWVVLVVLFNVAGAFAYWAMNHTPVIRCTACGKRRGLSLPTCCACEAELPAPEPRDVDLVLPEAG